MNSKRELNSAQKLIKNGTYEFAEFSFDRQEKILRRGEEIVSMPPKTCELLAALLENRGRLMTKDELFAQVWADTFVEEANLSHHIAVLRKALGENKDSRKFIETIPRKGYRFVCEIIFDDATEIVLKEFTRTRIIEDKEVETDDEAAQNNQTAELSENEKKLLPAARFRLSRRRKFALGAAVCLAVVIGTMFAWRFFTNSRPLFFDDSTRGNWRVAPVVEGKSRVFGSISQLSVAPDGRFIAFDRRVGSKSTLFVKQIGGGEAVRLTDGKWAVANPIWFADGQRIAFLSNRDGLVGVWTIPFMGGTPALLARLPVAPRRPFAILKMSGDANRIFYEAESKLYSLDVHDPSAAPVLLFEQGENFEGVNDFAISPDETLLALTANRGDDVQLFVASLTDKSQKPEQLTFDAGEKRHPAWFAKGRQIVFSSNASGKFQIYALDLPSSETKQLTLDAAENDEPLVASNDDSIYFHAADEEANVYSFSLETRTEKAYTESTGLQIFPAAAPDGSRVAFQTTASSTAIFDSDLKILQPDDAMRTLTVAKRIFNPKWSPDGGSLAFVRSVGGKFNLWKVSANGQNETELTADGINPTIFGITPFNIVHENFNFSPDGKQIVYASLKSGAANVWTVSTDGTKSERNWTNYTGEAAAVLGYHFSPDGQKIVFFVQLIPASETEPKTYRVCVTDGTRTQALYETKAAIRILGWSETGREIYLAEHEINEETREKIVRLLKIPAAENSAPQVMTRISRADYDKFRLSPDKQSILYIAVEERSENENLYFFSISNASPQRLTDNHESSVYYSGADFAPDGKTIFYSKQTSGDVYALLTISK